MYPEIQNACYEVTHSILASLKINRQDVNDPVLRQITNVASKTLGVPGVIINFVLPEEQITVSGSIFESTGFMENYRMAREHSVCRMIKDENLEDLQVTDIRTNERTKLLPIVKLKIKSLFMHKHFRHSRSLHGDLTAEYKRNEDNTLKFYYGAKLKVENTVIGAVCALDVRPRPDWTKQQKQVLKEFAKIVTNYLLERKRWAQKVEKLELKVYRKKARSKRGKKKSHSLNTI